MSNMTSSAKPKLAMFKTFELHDNHAGKSNVKTEVSIPNPPQRRSTTWKQYAPTTRQDQYSPESSRRSATNSSFRVTKGHS
jgi:hypothetical protein